MDWFIKGDHAAFLDCFSGKTSSTLLLRSRAISVLIFREVDLRLITIVTAWGETPKHFAIAAGPKPSSISFAFILVAVIVCAVTYVI